MKRLLSLVAVALSLGAGPALGQDSTRADWRAWFATRDSVARCIKGPLVSRVYGGEGEFTVHRTPSGGTCQAGPGPGEPTAWVIDSRLFCPDSSPSTWMNAPANAPKLDENTVVSIEPTRDSTVLASLECGIRPRTAIVIGTRASADARTRTGAGLDLTFARHSIRGGTVNYRTGALFDLVGAVRVKSIQDWHLLMAGGAGVVLGGIGESCLLRPDGSCAPRGNLGMVNALAGAARPVGGGTVRMLAGPAFSKGAGAASLGLQGRFDVSYPMTRRVGVGGMLRVTELPSHGGDNLTLLAGGVSLTLR